MADKKISELTALTGANVATDDQLVIVDTSAALTKSITIDEFKNALDTATGFVRITGDTMTGALTTTGLTVDGTATTRDDASTTSYYSTDVASNVVTHTSNGTGAFAQEVWRLNDGGTPSEKMRLTTTGIDITGTGTFNNNVGVVVSGATPTIRITETDTTDENTQLIQASGTFRIRTASDDYATTTERMRIDHGTGDISFFDDQGSSQSFYWDASAERLGIGTSSPSAPLDIEHGTVGEGINVSLFSTTQSNGPVLRLAHSLSNTVGTQAAVTVNDVLGKVLFAGSDGSSFYDGAAIIADASQTFSGTAGGTRLEFHTTGSGTQTLDQRMVIDQDGSVGIGTSSPSVKLDIAGTSGTESFRIGSTVGGTDFGITVTENDGVLLNAAEGATARNMKFATGGTERMRLNTSGNLSLNSDGNLDALDGVAGMQIGNSSAASAGLALETSSRGYLWYVSSSNLKLWDSTANSDRLVIDSSGNLLVGTTDSTLYNNTSGGGFKAGGDNRTDMARQADVVAIMNRTGNSDGTILDFRKDGATVGSIQSRAGVVSTIILDPRTGSLGTGITGSGANLSPTDGSGAEVDTRNSIGTSDYRFKNLYLSDGTFIGAFSNTGAYAGKSVTASGRLTESSTGATTAKVHRAFYNPNGQVGTITTDGSATAYNTSSDYRLKTDAQPMTGATNRLKQLNPVNFEWIADGTRVDGFLAHEAQAVVPEAVTGAKDAMRDEEYEVTPAVTDDDGNVTTEAVMDTRSVPDYQGIDQSKLVPLLVATIQELEARITALENA